MAHEKPKDWPSQETQDLIAWFLAARSRLHDRPFRLTQASVVVDTARFYRHIEESVIAGPLGYYVDTALTATLRNLKKATEGVIQWVKVQETSTLPDETRSSIASPAQSKTRAASHRRAT